LGSDHLHDGAVINYERVKNAFGNVPVDLIDDAGPVFPEARLGLAPQGFGPWNLRAGFPAGCTACQTDVSAAYAYLSATYPNSRFAFTGFDQDETISLLLLQNPAYPTYYDNLRTLLQGLPTSNWRYFVPDGKQHGVLFDIEQTVTTNSNPASANDPSLPHTVSPHLADWLGNMIHRSGAWENTTAQ
jgi:hypothetical protein